MKKAILVCFVASLFIGTTLAGASVIKTNDLKSSPLHAYGGIGNAGIKDLNERTAIASYTKPASLIGLEILLGNKDFFSASSQQWYTTITIIAEWLYVKTFFVVRIICPG